MILLDTNVISEVLRPKPSEAVRAWMTAQRPLDVFTTSICEAEIFCGLALMPAGRRRAALEHEIETIFSDLFANRCLAFDSAAARAFATIVATRRQSGHPIRDADAQIAAIAASHGASLATRNTADFRGCGVSLVNPWEA